MPGGGTFAGQPSAFLDQSGNAGAWQAEDVLYLRRLRVRTNWPGIFSGWRWPGGGNMPVWTADNPATPPIPAAGFWSLDVSPPGGSFLVQTVGEWIDANEALPVHSQDVSPLRWPVLYLSPGAMEFYAPSIPAQIIGEAVFGCIEAEIGHSLELVPA